MAIIDKNGRVHQYRGGRKDNILIKVTYSGLARLFGCSRRTIYRWVKDKKLNPTSLIDIVDKYINRWKVDSRLGKKDQ